MIKAIYQSEDKKYTYLNVSGHALSDDYGKDLICASVSSIIFGLMNALDNLNDELVSINQSENEIEIINDSDNEIINNYIELVIIQLKTIEVSYGDFIKVERK
jgi:uncharacterized protein YsxB (DUF464 family)